MGIVVRQSAKSVILTYLGIGFGIINTLWLFPYILTGEQIGLARTLISVSVLFSTFALLGAANIPNKFFFHFKNLRKQHNGFLFFILIVGGIGFLIFTALYLNYKSLFFSAFIKNSPLILNYYYLIIPFTLIMLLTAIFESYNVIQQNPVVPIFTREVLSRIFLSISLLVFFFAKFQFSYFIYLLVSFYWVILIILIFYTHSQNYLFITPNFEVFKSPLLKSILVYAGFIVMGNASGVVINNIDSLMLSAYSGLKITGVYTIAFFIATFIEIPKRSMSQVLIPLISEANKDNDIKKLGILYKKSSITQLIIGGIIFLLIWFNSDNIFRLIPHGNLYSQGKWVVFFIGLGKIFDMFTGVNQEIIGSSKYYKIDLSLFPFYGLVAVLANMFFIPKLGMTGAAIATASSVFLINIIRSSILYITMNIQPFTFNTLKTLSVFAISFVINYFLPHIQKHFLIDIVFRSIIIVCFIISLVLLTKVSEDIDIIIQKMIKRLHLWTR